MLRTHQKLEQELKRRGGLSLLSKVARPVTERNAFGGAAKRRTRPKAGLRSRPPAESPRSATSLLASLSLVLLSLLQANPAAAESAHP
jgi:hypothetical protein